MIHTAFPHAYIPRVSPISRLAWTSGHNRSSGTTVCRIPISCGKVIAASVWIVCRTGISAVYRFRWTSPPHFSSDPRNLQRKERKQCILIRISYESDQLLQGNWILNTYRKDEMIFFLFLLFSFGSKINIDFVQFEIVFSQIVNVFGAKAAHFTLELW